jgi:hypothetical protein
VNKQLKRHLDKEMEHIHFSRKQNVLNEIKRQTWKNKLHRLWNKEISIPLIPVSTAFVLFIMALGYVELSPLEQNDKKNQDKKLIQVAGNYYWKDEFERALLKNEN